MSANEQKMGFRKDVQGLRALAIAVVVLAHAHVTGFAGGFVGVDVFFVLSGYLITGLLVREKVATGSVHYGRFLARRLKRLLPAMLLMAVAVLTLAAVLLSAYEARMQTGAFPYAVTWTSNLYFALGKFDYFIDLQTSDLFLHTWSLGVEEQFYIVWPWLVMLAVGSTAAATPEKSTKVLVYLFSAVLLVSLGLCLHWTKYEPLLGFYMMPSRGWQFASGALVFLLRDGISVPRTIPAPAQRIAGVAGVAMMVAAATLLDPTMKYPGLYALLPSFGAALFLSACPAASPVNAFFSTRPMVWLGDRSYSLYLWHWPILMFGEAYSLTDSAAGLIALVGAAMLMADLSYRFVELPFWKGRYSDATPIATVATSAVVATIAIGVGWAVTASVFGPVRVADHADNYNPRLDMPKFYAPQFGCDSWYESAEVVACANGPEAERIVVLFGDSIGVQWEPLISQVFRHPEWQLTILTKSGCAIVDETYYYDRVGGDYEICTQWRERAVEFIKDKKPDVLFVGSSAHYELSARQWVEGSTRIFDELAGESGDIVVLPATPMLSFNGPSCVSEPRRYSARLEDSRRECEERQVDVRGDEVADYLREAASAFENVDVLHLNDLVCPGGRCAAQTPDGMTVYRDSRHLTTRCVRAQADEFRQRLRPILATASDGDDSRVAVADSETD